jgi:hypothetical protein
MGQSFCHEIRKPVGVALAIVLVENEALAFDPAKLAQSITKCSQANG